MNIVVSLAASPLLDGKLSEYNEYTIRGQKARFLASGQPEQEQGWYLVPGKIDRASYGLLAFFVATCLFLIGFQASI